jgi:hypothetical protein
MWKSEWWRNDAEAIKSALASFKTTPEQALHTINQSISELFALEEVYGLMYSGRDVYELLVRIVACGEYIEQEPSDAARVSVVVSANTMLDCLWQEFYANVRQTPNVLGVSDMAALRLEYLEGLV